MASRLVAQGDYESQSGVWVRRQARRKGARFPASTEIVTVIEKDTGLDGDALAFMDGQASSSWTRMLEGAVQFRGRFDDLARIIDDAEKTAEKPWRLLHHLSQALTLSGPELLRPMLRRHVAPCFFRRWPAGRIVVLRYDLGVDTAAALLRVQYAAAQAPLAELREEGFRGIRTMANWHMASLTRLVPALLAAFNNLCYPFVGGSSANPPGLAFLFLLDPPERIDLEPFPRNWLAIPGSACSFGRESADAAEILQDLSGPAHQRASHGRYRHDRGFTADERLGLLRWYIDRVNRLLYELTDAANFTEGHDPEAPIDPVFGYEHQLTADRLMLKTLLSMSLDEAPTANLMAFDVADLYDTLGVMFRHRDGSGKAYGPADFFKSLFNPQEGPRLLAGRLAMLPEPFAGHFSGVAATAYAALERTVLGSVWRKGKVTGGGVMVRDKTLSSEALMPAPQFVAEVMRAYRNAHHGYFSAEKVSQNRPSRFLYLADGDLPVELSALPVLWWLAYLADPGLVGWRHLPLGAFD
ncbi:MAG: hypothetical protein ACRC33_24105 [Gemmataceae bacterium]